MNPDGIPYMELAVTGMRVGWKGLLNAYWSPLYPFLLSLVFRLFHPALYWESTAIHLLNFAIYLANLACFEVFLKELIRGQEASDISWAEGMTVPPQTVWSWAGYIFFLWVYQFWQSIVVVTPDLCVAGLAFLATAALLRIRAGRGNWTVFACLGAILGVSYWAKAAMFPLAFVFLACAFLAMDSPRRALPRTIVALLIFLLLATPLVAGLSLMKHRVTFGDTARINYAVYVGGVPAGGYWQGEPPGTGTPAHPVRKLLSIPSLYEFAAPIEGSCPLAYDPSYWFEGVKLHFSPKGQFLAFFRAAVVYLEMFFKSGALCVVCIALFLLVRKAGRWTGRARNQWMVWLPACAALGMYATVHVEPRFVGGFALILLMSFFVGVRLTRISDKKLLCRTALVMILAPAIPIVWSAGTHVVEIVRPRPFDQWEVAQGLRAMGIQPGTRVGMIGNLDCYWAHLAGVQVVAGIHDSDRASFWGAEPGTKTDVMNKFGEAGARIVVAGSLPARAIPDWEQVARTHYYFHRVTVSAVK
jgi:hypothetical protein